MGKITEAEFTDWLGSDQGTAESLISLIMELLNGDYTVQELKHDIESYRE